MAQSLGFIAAIAIIASILFVWSRVFRDDIEHVLLASWVTLLVIVGLGIGGLILFT